MRQLFSVLISIFSLGFVSVHKALASDVFGINDLASTNIALGSRSIEDTVAGIINIFLGFLGILAVLIILYGGFLWMTSQGNSDKVQRAKLLIISAVIGLVIIVSAYAISRFVLQSLYNETGAGGPGGGTTIPPGGTIGCDAPADTTDPRICKLNRENGPAGSNLTIYGYHFDRLPVSGNSSPDSLGMVQLEERSSGTRFTVELVVCADPQWKDTWVRVRVPDTLAEGVYDVFLTNDLGNITDDAISFVVTPGLATLNLNCLSPEEAFSGTSIDVQATGTGFTDFEENISMEGWDGAAVVTLDNTTLGLGIGDWTDTQINMNVPLDLANLPNAISSEVTVTVGTEWDSLPFVVLCDTDSNCASGCCYADYSCLEEDVCTAGSGTGGDDAPVIENITPEDGAVGNLITIFGYNFGDDMGVVRFESLAGPGWVEGDLPSYLSNGSCVNIWTNNYIIIGVPADAVVGVGDLTVVQSAAVGGLESDPYPFERNDTIIRPSICALSDSEGYYSQDITIDGIGFQTTDQAYFDTVVSYDTSVTDVTPPGTYAIAEVPNVAGYFGVTMHTDAGEISNPYPFTAIISSGGLPIINEISPAGGPVGQYITIMGSGFGSSGEVRFDPSGLNVRGDDSFPVMCGDSFWSDSQILVKVPEAAWTLDTNYEVVVVRGSDSAISESYSFEIQSGDPAPGICLIDPNNGPAGYDDVDIFGENFGAIPGSVYFYNEQSVGVIPPASWNDNQVLNLTVPAGAVTGPVYVQDSGGDTSNEVNFAVGECQNTESCQAAYGESYVCCPEATGDYCTDSCGVDINACYYSWNFYTEDDPFGIHYNYNCDTDVQSPSPWPDGHEWEDAVTGFISYPSSVDAFTDANISILFTRNVVDADLLDSDNFRVYACNHDPDLTGFAPGSCEVTSLDGNLSIINHNSSREGVEFNPGLDEAFRLDAGRWYRVVLGSFKSSWGGDVWDPTMEDPDFDWYFRVRNDTNICEVSNVVVSPQRNVSDIYVGSEREFYSTPVADNCNVCGGNYDWAWSLDPDPAPIASYATLLLNDVDNENINRGYNIMQGGPNATQFLPDPNYASINAQNLDFAISGTSQSMILAPTLSLLDYGPRCNDSCLNAGVWAIFSTQLDSIIDIDGTYPDQIAIYRCTDTNCNTYDNSLNYVNGYTISDELLTINHIDFIPQENYKVILSADLINTYSYSLGAEKSWNFSVGDENCELAGAYIRPDGLTVTNLNDILYTAYTYGEVGICGADFIQCDDGPCNYTWSTDEPATYFTLDTGARQVWARPLGPNGTAPIDLDISGDYGPASASTNLTINVSGGNALDLDLHHTLVEPTCGAVCTTSLVRVCFDKDVESTSIPATGFSILSAATGEHFNGADWMGPSNPQCIKLNYTGIGRNDNFTVTVPAGIEGIDGSVLRSDINWNFGTGDSECFATGALVSPDYRRITTPGESWVYQAYGTWSSEECSNVTFDCTACTYDWSLSNGFASIVGSNILQSVEVQDNQTTDAGTVEVMVNLINEHGDTVEPDSGVFEIDTAGTVDPLFVTNHYPDCDGSCSNADVTIYFNSDLRTVSLPGNYHIYDDTLGTEITGLLTTIGNRQVLIDHTPFVLGHDYRVVLDGTIQNTDLSFLYNGAGYTYTFGIGAADCGVDRARVEPQNVTAGASQPLGNYIAQTIHDSVVCGEEPINCPTCNYNWFFDTPNIAVFSSPLTQTTDVTTNSSPPLVGGEHTEVNVTVAEGTSPPVSTDPGDINIIISGPVVYPTPEVVDINPDHLETNICLNIAPNIEFSETMNRASIISQGRFYEECAGTCEVTGTWTFRETTNGTQAMFNPDINLNPNLNYWISFANTDAIVSVNGVSLDPTGLFTTPMGGLGWMFTAGDRICQVHSADISRNDLYIDSDLFNCAGINNCPGDSRPAIGGNQHTYIATVYDISGAILSGTFLDYTWDSTQLSDDVVFSVLDSDQETDGTAQPTNGQAVLSVDVENSTDDPGHIVRDTALVEVMLCEEPWPNLSSYPWTDPEMPSTNFSTYYCQYSGLPGDNILPYLAIPSLNNPDDPDVYREFISTINYLTVKSGTNAFGSLAYYDDYQTETKESVWQKITKLFNKPAFAFEDGVLLCGPVTPRNFAITFDGINAHLSWNQPNYDPDLNGPTSGFLVQRMLIGDDVDWQNYATAPAGANSWTDPEDLELDREYRYRIAATSNTCDDFPSSNWAGPITLYTNASHSLVDIIGIRVIQNSEHLSVMDWYLKNAPNPSDTGSLVSIDGYEALKVGNTLYIAASNVTTNIYTNIYIIAHNIGARPSTINIFNQMVSNFKLNINITENTANICNISGLSCSTDYDCPGENDYCEARKLKLRRDTKRLSDLIAIQRSIMSYGEAHASCSYDSSISCNDSTDCPGGECIKQYPPLNAGSYLQGLTNSRWPSWTATLGSALGMSIPSDPINRFNIDGCSDPYNTDTCWSESTLEFFCPTNSLIYYYNSLDFGRGFTLRANFEYDMYDTGGVTFASSLVPSGWSTLYGLASDLGIYCDDAVQNSPGAAAWPNCGNGIVDTEPYCTISCPNCDNSVDCVNSGGRWVQEECDGNFWSYACSQDAPNSNPDILTNGNHPWWNEQTIGCYPPGSLDSVGNSIGCQWYPIDRSQAPFTASQCGGYCGDGAVQTFYENCDGNLPSGYSCDDGDSISCSGCQVMCTGDGGSYPAALCGDGIWTPGVEECDNSANPNGLDTWDCTEGGAVRCSNSCVVECTVGDPYTGACGDGEVNFPEEQCDYAGYVAPGPDTSGPANTYTCSNQCQFTGDYCGNGILEYAFQEICDTNYETPLPEYSSKFNQYECRMSGIFWDFDTGNDYGRCTATEAGWCGDGFIQDIYEETCDPAIAGDLYSPNETSLINQYVCDDYDCDGRVGGYCGDGEVQSDYNEICDGLDYPDRPTPAESDFTRTYTCDMTSNNRCQQSASGGGYCGDNIQQTLFGEGCDWNVADPEFSYPWPRQRDNITIFSDPSFQYECSDCLNTGGYCGDGVVQSYEDCDTGFDPAYEIEKNIDLVYVFDMSGSMRGDAQALCTATQGVVANLEEDHQEIDYRITIYVLGDNDGGVAYDDSDGTDTPDRPYTPVYLTDDDADDIESIFPNNGGWLDEALQVFRALYTDCALNDNVNYPKVRYLSFYDNTSNDINVPVTINGDIPDFDEACHSNNSDQFAGRLENWGYAISKIIEGYNWKPGYQRVVLPVSDEAAYCGGNSIIHENEDYDASLPDVLYSASQAARLSDPAVHISPVLRRFTPIYDIGQRLADDTGGLFTNEVTGWAAQTIKVINSSFCDGNGDAHMDCTLEP
ncbi:Ig-like domain-containing protein [Patescibacteria group bacterium]|nr:Ig-like domain-containing protein [Patescibacteria group bacterium]